MAKSKVLHLKDGKAKVESDLAIEKKRKKVIECKLMKVKMEREG